MRSPHRTGLYCVAAAALAWSTAGLFTRALPFDAATLLFWRGTFGSLGTLVLIAALPATGGLAGFRRLGRPGLGYAAVTALSMLCFIGALLTTTVAHVAVLTAVVPFVAAFLGWALLHEAPRPAAILASLAAVAGVAVMVGLGTEGTWQGDLLAMAMATLMAGMILISRRFPGIPALPATALAAALSAIATLPFLTGPVPAGADLALVLAFALVNQVLGFGLFAIGARHLPPMESALLTTLDAPLAPLWVWLVSAETPSPATLSGGTIVLAAVLLHIRHEARQNPAP